MWVVALLCIYAQYQFVRRRGIYLKYTIHQVNTVSSIYTFQHWQLSATYVTIDSQNTRGDLCVCCVCGRERKGGRRKEREKGKAFVSEREQLRGRESERERERERESERDRERERERERER